MHPSTTLSAAILCPAVCVSAIINYNNSSGHFCWVVQAGLLTPLTFARHRLSPLAAFTFGAYFLHNGSRLQRICEFYTANFKGVFGGP